MTYVPIVPCTVLDTRTGSGELTGDEIRAFRISDAQGLVEGGSSECGFPLGGEARIRAWAMDVRTVDSEGSGSVKVWQGEHPEPATAVSSFQPEGGGGERFANVSVLPACGPVGEGECVVASLETTAICAQVAGQ